MIMSGNMQFVFTKAVLSWYFIILEFREKMQVDKWWEKRNINK